MFQSATIIYTIKSRVSDQNGVSLLYIMLKIHHSGREPSKLSSFYLEKRKAYLLLSTLYQCQVCVRYPVTSKARPPPLPTSSPPFLLSTLYQCQLQIRYPVTSKATPSPPLLLSTLYQCQVHVRYPVTSKAIPSPLLLLSTLYAVSGTVSSTQ